MAALQLREGAEFDAGTLRHSCARRTISAANGCQAFQDRRCAATDANIESDQTPLCDRRNGAAPIPSGGSRKSAPC